MIRVLIVARLPIIREGLKGLLASERDLKLTTLSHFESGGLVEEVLADRPEVTLIDVEVLEQEGWGLLNDLQGLAPDIASLVVSDTVDDQRVASALAMGAHGYLTRDATLEEMASAIRAAQRGLFVLDPRAARTLLEKLPPDPDTLQVTDDEFASPGERSREVLIEPLTTRELDVLRLTVRGMSNKQIASELIITEHTVKFHIRSILAKLGAANRTEAVTLALQKGLVSL